MHKTNKPTCVRAGGGLWSDYFLTSRSTQLFDEIVWKHSLFPVQFSLTPTKIHIYYICNDVSNFQRKFIALLRLVAKCNASSSTYQTPQPFRTQNQWRFVWDISRKVILTHGDFKIKEQLGKCNEKCKIGLHLENYDDNFNFCWKEFFPSELEGVLEKHAERSYG